MEPIFNKVADLQACNFIKKRLQRRCFPENTAKILRTHILKNISKRLLLNKDIRTISRRCSSVYIADFEQVLVHMDSTNLDCIQHMKRLQLFLKTVIGVDYFTCDTNSWNGIFPSQLRYYQYVSCADRARSWYSCYTKDYIELPVKLHIEVTMSIR